MHDFDQLFSEIDRARVFSIQGEWGSGKTHFWKERSAALKNYSPVYVSLFMLDSIDQVEQRIIGELLHRKTGGRLGGEALSQLMETARINVERLVTLPERLATEFTFRRELIESDVVCLDDVERSGVDVDRLMGFADYLREQYKINVVLIFNQNAVSEKHHNFSVLADKVIDRQIHFCPSIRDCVEVAVEHPNLVDKCAEQCECLGLKNIRIIRRAYDYATEIANRLIIQKTDELLGRFMDTLLLACYVRYGESSELGAIEYFMFDRTELPTNKLPALEDGDLSARRAKLVEYGYEGPSRLDKVLVQFVIDGSLDVGVLTAETKAFEDIESYRRQRDELTQLYDETYNANFGDSKNEFVRRLENYFDKYFDSLVLSDLTNILDPLFELGCEAVAEPMMNRYVEQNKEYLLERDYYGALHTRLRQAINELRASSVDKRPLAEVAEMVTTTSSWQNKDALRLSAFRVEEWVAHFSREDGKYDVVRHARKLSKWGQSVGNSNTDVVNCSRTVTAALKIIARDSDYNRMRIGYIIGLENLDAGTLEADVSAD